LMTRTLAPTVAGPNVSSADRARSLVRPPLAVALWPLVRPFRRSIERGRDGARLRPGITAVVAARNEAYAIDLCLRSLVGFADQIICVDNGSTDGTLERMNRFRDSCGDQAEVDIVSLPNGLLVDCREEGLRRTRHQWHLRWDADMVAKTSGPENLVRLRDEILRDDRPRTMQLSYTNLIGDLRHTVRIGNVVAPGEHYLARFGRGIGYREYGRYEEMYPRTITSGSARPAVTSFIWAA
jgi:glycosyltransferase involved in cell wall biosynthesis